jgi:hypothetical protein
MRRKMPPMSQDSLKTLRRELAKLGPSALVDRYRAAYLRCDPKFSDGLPEATDIQELVQVWRALWKWRDGRR